MLKDTKSLGNNKAPACESRGFVHKKEGAHFDTPSYCIMIPLMMLYLNREVSIGLCCFSLYPPNL